MSDALVLSNISKSFGSVRALDEISFSVPEQSITVLMGPSGCGKTTALRCIAGFERPEAGEIVSGEKVLSSESIFLRPEARHIGFVPQEGALFPHLTVGENIAFGLPKGRGRNDRVAQVLALVELDGFEKRKPHELSGGQQQRVALARALAPRPAIVLMDEPFSALDAALRPEVCAQVTQALRAEKTTAIVVTHDRDEALSIADQLVVMLNGKVQCAGTPIEIYQQQHNEEVQALLGDAKVVRGQLQGKSVATEDGTYAVTNAQSNDGVVDVIIRKQPVSVYKPKTD